MAELIVELSSGQPEEVLISLTKDGSMIEHLGDIWVYYVTGYQDTLTHKVLIRNDT